MKDASIMNQINFYCDESCHIQNDGNPVMTIATLYCSKKRVKVYNASIKKIKEKHSFNRNSEMKWSKVSPCNIDFYREIIDYVADNYYIKIRIIVCKRKDEIISNSEKGTYDDWYSKMYYTLLKFPIEYIDEFDLTNSYNLYIDRKDSRSVGRCNELARHLKVLFGKEINSHACDSKEHELIQVADIFAGASSYAYREKKDSHAKIELMNYIREKFNIDYFHSSKIKDKRSNLFVWNGRDYL